MCPRIWSYFEGRFTLTAVSINWNKYLWEREKGALSLTQSNNHFLMLWISLVCVSTCVCVCDSQQLGHILRVVSLRQLWSWSETWKQLYSLLLNEVQIGEAWHNRFKLSQDFNSYQPLRYFQSGSYITSGVVQDGMVILGHQMLVFKKLLTSSTPHCLLREP